jgi:predicted component of type VI protein secretion system
MTRPGERSGAKLRRLVLAAGLAAGLALVAAGCGKKPDGVLPPQGEENDAFPRSYPSE